MAHPRLHRVDRRARDQRHAGLALLAAIVAACGGRTYLGQGHSDGGTSTSPPDASWTACGDAACDPSTEFCKRTVGGPPPGVDIQTCEPLPPGCTTCDCVLTTACTCIDDTGHITLTCDVP